MEVERSEQTIVSLARFFFAQVTKHALQPNAQ